MIYQGVDVAAEKFIEEALAHKPEVIGLSALLITTIANMEDVI